MAFVSSVGVETNFPAGANSLWNALTGVLSATREIVWTSGRRPLHSCAIAADARHLVPGEPGPAHIPQTVTRTSPTDSSCLKIRSAHDLPSR